MKGLDIFVTKRGHMQQTVRAEIAKESRGLGRVLLLSKRPAIRDYTTVR